MLFPTHLVASAVLGRLLAGRPRDTLITSTGRSWPALSTGSLIFGAALPDLIDKPLGMAGVTELFHSVGHSALLLPVVVAVALAGRRGAAIAVGWVSHLGLDALHVVINGRPSDALFLGWPLAVPPTPLAIPPGEFVRYYLGTPSFYLEVVIWFAAAGFVVWSLHADATKDGIRKE